MHEFISLKQGSMSVKNYSLKITLLGRYALTMVDDSRACTSEFMSGAYEDMIEDCRILMLVKKMYIVMMMVHS